MSKSWHKIQSQHNDHTNSFLFSVTPLYQDWEITTMFYSVVHLVNAYLDIHLTKYPRTHNQREQLIDQYLQQIATDYYTLKDICQRARYLVETTKLQPNEITEARRCQQTIISEISKLI